jgi:dipeptidyl aminopeptidase/acylaminoacyl peptidase
MRWLLLLVCLLLACGKRDDVGLASVGPPAALTVQSEHASELEGGVHLREVVLDRHGEPMTLWIYRSGPVAPGTKRPVVLIAPAGTPLCWGMALGEGDRPEHLPWAQKGYLAVAYSLDGHVEDEEKEALVDAAVRRFLRAHAGLDNARAALDWVLTHEPDADASRVFASGHSSAATLALRFAAEDARVKAVVACNGITDVVGHMPADSWAWLESVVPGARRQLRASSPLEHAAQLRKKPVFLFHSVEDTTVPISEAERLMEATKPAHPSSRFAKVPTGDHYDSMLQQGLPMGIEWASRL